MQKLKLPIDQEGLERARECVRNNPDFPYIHPTWPWQRKQRGDIFHFHGLETGDILSLEVTWACMFFFIAKEHT